MKFQVRDGASAALGKKLRGIGTRLGHTLAEGIAADTAPYVPADTGALAAGTRVEGNRIVYPGPYARVLYDGRAMVEAETGKGPMRVGGKTGGAVRFHKGARLRPSEKPLRMGKSPHPRAADHWFEASKAENLKKWTEEAGKAVEHELK